MLYPQEYDKTSIIRDAGLYFSMETIDGITDNLRGKVRIIEETEETFYGRKEIVFEDINGCMITFSCEPKMIQEVRTASKSVGPNIIAAMSHPCVALLYIFFNTQQCIIYQRC